MTLSITQRITLTVAIVSGLALALVGAALFLYSGRGIEAAGTDKAAAKLLRVEDAIWDHLGDDILTEFTNATVRFDELKMPFDDWAIIRKSGEVVGARGVFAESRIMVQAVIDQGLGNLAVGDLQIATALLAAKEHIRWSDIPDPVQRTVRENVSGGMFLAAEREGSEGPGAMEIMWLHADYVLDLVVAGDGELLEKEREDLPEQLPEGMAVVASSGETLLEPEIAGWQAYDNELIAMVEGRLGSGKTGRGAVNGLGERFEIRPDGKIERKLVEFQFWVIAGYDQGREVARSQLFRQGIWLGGGVMWLLIVLVAWLVTRHALGRVDEIIGKVEGISPAQLDERLPVEEANDELSRLSRTVNEMLDRVRDGYRREQQFTGDASHEMRNPLAKIVGEIELVLSKSRKPQEYEETLGRLKKYAEDMQRLIESLLTLARLEGRLQNLEMKPFDIADLAIEILKLFPQDSTQRIRMELGESAGPLQVVGHRHLVGIAMSNLIDNALRYSPSDSPVYLRIDSDGGMVRIEVEDEGPGVPKDQTVSAFHRFRRLDESRSKQTGGSGLGLSIVKAIADVHDTEVTLTAGAKQGTVATLRLPLADHENDGGRLSS